MTRQNRLYDKLRTKRALKKAWNRIYENGKRSSSLDTQKFVNEFAQAEEKNIQGIFTKLKTRDFDFGKSRGLGIKKKSGKLRPLVSATVEARIIQRAKLG